MHGYVLPLTRTRASFIQGKKEEKERDASCFFLNHFFFFLYLSLSLSLWRRTENEHRGIIYENPTNRSAKERRARILQTMIPNKLKTEEQKNEKKANND